LIDEGLAEKHTLLRRYEELSTAMAEANASDMDALLRLLFVCFFFSFFFFSALVDFVVMDMCLLQWFVVKVVFFPSFV
jgi:hypothetical protein